MDEWKKFKCYFCGYELVSKSKTPRCTKCRSTRLQEITQLSTIKTYMEGGKMDEVKPIPANTGNSTPAQIPAKHSHKSIDQDLWEDYNDEDYEDDDEDDE